jgi:hypothetical protein
MKGNRSNKRMIKIIILGISLMGAFPGMVSSIYGSAPSRSGKEKAKQKKSGPTMWPRAGAVPQGAGTVLLEAEAVPLPRAEAVPPRAETALLGAEAVPPEAEAVPPGAEAVPPPEAEAVPPGAGTVPPPRVEAVPPGAGTVLTVLLEMGEAILLRMEVALQRVRETRSGAETALLVEEAALLREWGVLRRAGETRSGAETATAMLAAISRAEAVLQRAEAVPPGVGAVPPRAGADDAREKLFALFKVVFFTPDRISADLRAKILGLYDYRDSLESVVALFRERECGKKQRNIKQGELDLKENKIGSAKQNILDIFAKERFIRALVEFAIFYMGGLRGVNGVNVDRIVRQIVDRVEDMYTGALEGNEIKANLMSEYPDYEGVIDFAIWEIEHRRDETAVLPELYILRGLHSLEVQSLRAVKRIRTLYPAIILAIVERIEVVLMDKFPSCGALISLATKVKSRFQTPYAPPCAPTGWEDERPSLPKARR